MNKKVLGIVIIAIVLTLGIVVAINYSENSTDKGQKNIPVEEQTRDENQEKVEVEEQESQESTDKDSIELKEDEELESQESTDIAIGELAPDFTLKNLQGKDVSLSDYRGKIVLINFWATWCKFCDIEMPDLNMIDKENEDVVVLAVDVMEEAPKVKKYIEKGGYGFEVVLDEKGDIAKDYLVSSFPTTYAVDEKGILIGGVPGMLTKEKMQMIIENVRGKE